MSPRGNYRGEVRVKSMLSEGQRHHRAPHKQARKLTIVPAASEGKPTSMCHAGPSGQALRTHSLFTDAEATGVTALLHSWTPPNPPRSPCRPLPALHEGLSHGRSNGEGNRTFFIKRAYLIFKG